MRLPTDLLQLATHLSTKEPRRPRQASLRRAISSAYYGLFHLLVEEASRLLAPARPTHLRPLLARAFQHGEMAKVSRTFSSGGPLATHHAGLIPNPDLAFIASAFLKLQTFRHSADYDVSARFTKTEAQAYIAMAEDAFRRWRNVRKTDEGRTFLTALLAEKSWRR